MSFFFWSKALVGAQVCDHVFLLMTDAAVELFFSNRENLQLGVDVGVAIGPLGRALEADVGAAPGTIAPIYTYSLSKGLYAGISVDGKIIKIREKVNAKFYGKQVTGMELLSGEIPTPPAARILYEALQRCHVYAGGSGMSRNTNNRRPQGGGGVYSNNIGNAMMGQSSLSDGANNGTPISQPQQEPTDVHFSSGVSDITFETGSGF
jgi:hypothetical protein